MSRLTALVVACSIAAAAPVALHGTARSQQPAAAAKKAGQEKHPAIHAAINSLERARKELQAANHDFGGHRVDAIAAIDNALKQLRLADAYDKQ